MLPRVLRPELMDDPALATDAHRAALAGLARLNTLSGAGATMARAVREMAIRRGVKDFRTLSLLDVACGGGDVVAGILRVVPLKTCTLWDFSQTALDRAREQCGQSNITQYVRGDVFHASLPPADIVTCSLFLHHLTSEQAVLAMRAMANAARMGVIVSDLRRCKFGSLLAAVIPRLVTTSYVVHTDARLSAAAAWSEEELAVLCSQAGLLGARIERKFPARVLVTWDRAPALRGGA
jgi:2-polyprenyl-3-methyl-5-hydroxy-6-metoxy-1,4-benzoquinol methylase